MPERNTERRDDEEDTINEIFMRQRNENIQHNLQTMQNENMAQEDIRQSLPQDLVRRYELFILPGQNDKLGDCKMRDINSSTMGHLVYFKGIVVKTGDARPAAKVICYSCEACGFEAY